MCIENETNSGFYLHAGGLARARTYAAICIHVGVFVSVEANLMTWLKKKSLHVNE